MLIIVAGIHRWNEWRLKVTIWTFWSKCIKFTSRSRVFSIIIFIFLVLCLTRTINYLIKCAQEEIKEDAFLMTMMMMMQFDIVIDVFVASFYVHTNKLSFMKHIPTCAKRKKSSSSSFFFLKIMIFRRAHSFATLITRHGTVLFCQPICYIFMLPVLNHKCYSKKAR